MHKAIAGGTIMAGVAALALAVSGAGAQDAPPPAAQHEAALPAQPYSPALREPLENNLYFGDLHLHTNLSPDAFLNGTRSVSPEQAYRFAMGETIEADNGSNARLRRPLDFMAVTDHSEYLGVYPLLLDGDPRLLQ